MNILGYFHYKFNVGTRCHYLVNMKISFWILSPLNTCHRVPKWHPLDSLCIYPKLTFKKITCILRERMRGQMRITI